jgi:ketosteroid isomerase-like protein
MRIRYVAVLALALAACKPQAETEEAANARMSAEADSVKLGAAQMNVAFANDMKAGNVDSLMSFYADDATVMAPNAPAAHGTAAIRAAFNGMMAMGKPTAFTLTSDEVSANGPMAIERGHYSWTMMGPDNKPMTDNGKYLVHWHRIGGKWKIVQDMWSSDAAAMPMPAAPAAHGARRS